MTTSRRPRIGIILANLGTPDTPTAAGVRAYLREFLSDPRVIEVPRLVWFFILRLFILPLRSPRVAKAYAGIWEVDSPMRLTLVQQVIAVRDRLEQRFPEAELTVLPAMSYGNPRLSVALAGVTDHDELIVLPLFPQFSATSTAPVHDQVARWQLSQRRYPALQLIRDYHVHPDYIEALALRVEAHRAEHGPADRLLLSFHGIPQPYADKGDPYPLHCQATTAALRARLGLDESTCVMSFQSRFGLQEWLKPYTDDLLAQWGRDGVASVQVLCPAFSADCLETLEEIAIENGEHFRHHGGQRYEYIPALNVDEHHVQLMVNLLVPRVEAALKTVSVA